MGLRVSRVVTLASATGKYGGPYDTAKRQARIVAELGAEVEVVAAHLPGDGPNESRLTGVQLVLAPARQQLPFGDFLTLISLRMIRTLWGSIGKSDLVHISFAREAIPVVAAIICVLRGKAWIAQTHGMMTSRRSTMHSLVDRLVLPIFRRAAAVIALTETEERELKQLGRLGHLPFFTLGNPLPEALPREPASHFNRDAVFIARLHPRKRVEDFIDAARRAREHSWAERYTVVGPDAGDLNKVRTSLDMLPNLHYRGAVSSREIPDILLASAVFVLCSENEPWGNVLTSALALGVPVVVTRSSALAAQVERLGAGIVVSDRQPAEIASAVHRIVSDPDAAQTMSTNGRAYAQEHYSDASQMAALSDIYRGVLAVR
jgi:glycosyltransferase involved in cell wall biosynthesis